jgi:perosamine synthetase
MLFRDHGMSQSKKYWHDEVGYNYRLTNIQSAVGLAQFEKIEHILSKRQKIMNYYDENLFKPKKEFFKKSKIIDGQVIWLVSIILKNNVNRQNLIESLSKNNIDIRYFFYPLSDMKIYKSFCRNFTSVAHELGSTGIHLPTSLKYSESDLDKIINEFNDYFKNSV